ncbi:unnamed protein product [Hymenolepis diminuta]|uniref:RES domain-containing protein n=1 Tax=Hymenolepis diminuta TaxID=6216 RepID=A0A0R3ST37_HYMDI|nr:unnamed protein product [Hymenolepis diminuta]
MEKKHRLYELLALNQLYEEVSDAEEWMWSKTEEALIENAGRDLDECVTDQRIEECLTSRPPATDFVLIEKLSPLSDSPDRPIQAIIVRRQMIKLEHSNSPRISQWQDGLIEDWRELRELFKIKGELLQSAGTRLPLLNRCELLEALYTTNWIKASSFDNPELYSHFYESFLIPLTYFSQSGSVGGMVILNPYAHNDLVTGFDVTLKKSRTERLNHVIHAIILRLI